MPNNVKITSSHRVLMIALLAAAFALFIGRALHQFDRNGFHYLTAYVSCA